MTPDMDNVFELKGPSQPHLCFCLHLGVSLLYLIRSMSKEGKYL